MNAFELGLLVAIVAYPFYWLVVRELENLTDPDYLRRKGVVIVAERALQGHSGRIGTYMGHEVWESVTFMGMQYRFDRVASRSYRHRIGPRELFLEPGLVYLTD